MFGRYLKTHLMGLVRRAGAHQAPAASQPSISQRLQELDTLRTTGSVTDEEYKVKRSQIISEI